MPVFAKTTVARKETTNPDWFVIDAEDMVVGRLATALATVLMGKHKATYTPHVDTGDNVIVLNAHKIRFTGAGLSHPRIENLTTKMAAKTYDRYSGYPGGRRESTAVEVWEKYPERILQEAVRRMLPKNKLSRQMLKKLRLYNGTEHPHQAQSPKEFPEYLLPRRTKRS